MPVDRLPVDEGIRELATSEGDAVRAVSVTIPGSRPRLVAGQTVPMGGKLADDFERIRAMLTEEEPCAVLINIADVPETRGAWLFAVYLPATTPESIQHRWHVGSTSIMAEMLPVEVRELRVTKLSKITPEAVQRAAREAKEKLLNSRSAELGMLPAASEAVLGMPSLLHGPGGGMAKMKRSSLRSQRSRASLRANDMTTKASYHGRYAVQSDRNVTPAVVVVDPFSSGAILAAGIVKRGYHCIRVLSAKSSPVSEIAAEGVRPQFDATVRFDDEDPDEEGALDRLFEELEQLPWTIVAVLPGCETGVLLADRLVFKLGKNVLRQNGETTIEARRNKYLMGETIKKAGVRAAKQLLALDWPSAEAFLREWNPSPYKVIAKPNQSCGSDDVLLCQSEEEVKNAFNIIDGKVNGIGNKNEGILIQEFLDGQEFVVDMVSRDGKHKVMAIWEYDKRSANGQFNVYFGMKLRCVDDELTRSLVEYQKSVLDALEIRNGPSHGEIMVTAEGPVLVEVGARCHGGEGTWQAVTQACIGYNQIDVTLDAFFEEGRFMAIPPVPKSLQKSGRECFVVARQSGVVRGFPGFDEIRKFGSYAGEEIMAKKQTFMPLTVDCFTRPAAFQLVHEDESVVAADYERARELEVEGMWDFELMCPSAPEGGGAVVVVDPFSSGAQVAGYVLKLGHKLIMLFSELDSPVAQMVAAGTDLQGETIMHNHLNPDSDAALEDTVQKLKALPTPILAILAGAETGVLLADQLAEKFATRRNPLHLSLARRNKYIMGETIRKAGVRAVKQHICSDWTEAETFLREWNPSPYKVIAKPNQSSGSDGVFLCTSEEEVKQAFETINGAANKLGGTNEGVLVQEFLEGQEFVVDTVSRDGKHKVMCIWQYDKRRANGQFNVYYGMSCIAVDDDKTRAMVEYQLKVLDALEINNGPAHAEVMWTATGPCLVEVGSRCHGGEGTWISITTASFGYNQAAVTVDAYLRPEEFDVLPDLPTGHYRYGRELKVVSEVEGKIKSIPGIDIARGLRSFFKCEMFVQPGGQLVKTTDLFSQPGSIMLIHDDQKVVEEDYEAIRAIEGKGFFALE